MNLARTPHIREASWTAPVPWRFSGLFTRLTHHVTRLMSIAAQLTILLTALSSWAGTKAGRAAIIGDTSAFIQWLQGRTLNVGILFAGEDKRGEFEEAGVVDRKFQIFLTRSEGLVYSPGDALIRETGSGAALFTLVEEARDVVRALRFTARQTEVAPNYLGSRLFLLKESPAPGEHVTFDAYEMTFLIGSEI